MLQTLAFITARQWKVHKLRTTLTIFGIALGVAVYFAVRTANITLMKSLNVTIEKLAGKATLQITASESGSGFPEAVLEIVRSTPGVQIAEPVIEVTARTAFGAGAGAGENLLIIGVDATDDQQLREYQFDQSQSEIGDPLVYVAQPDSILISKTFAQKHGLEENDKLPLYTSEGRKDFTVRGIFKPVGIGEVFDGQIAVMDIYSAQFVFNRGRNFDRIDVMNDPNLPVETLQPRLGQRLPSGLEVTRPALRVKSIENAIAALRYGLLITSFIALFVGIFIIFNSFSMAVNQRWKELGILRALGVERSKVQWMFLGESLAMGLTGSSLGVAGGFYLAAGATRLMGAITATMYGYLSTSEPPIFRLDYAITSLALGIGASILAAWLPAKAASQLNVALALHNIETRQREAVLGWKRLISGAAMLLIGLLLLQFSKPKVGQFFSFGYMLLMLLGLIVMLPKLTQWLARTLRPVMDRMFGSEGALAVDTMIKSPHRTSATVGALMLGLSFVFSTGGFIKSEEQVLLRWMDRTINSDLFVKSSELVYSRSYHFSEELSRRIAAMPGVKRVENVRFTFVPYRGDSAAVLSIEMNGWFARTQDLIEGADEKKAQKLASKGEGALISRNFSSRWGLKVGDRIRLETPTGPFERPIVGLVEDYSSEKGSILMDRELYKRYWNDSAMDVIDINLNPGVDRLTFKRELQGALSGVHQAFIYTNEEYRKWVLKVVNQYFTINYLQMIVAIFVATLGIINTLIISVSERRRELGVIRAIGGLRRQIRKMVLLEAATIGFIGLILGALASVFAIYFLVKTASVIYAGFTIPFYFPLELILLSLPLVVAIALAAAWWPAQGAVNLHVIEAIGYE